MKDREDDGEQGQGSWERAPGRGICKQNRPIRGDQAHEQTECPCPCISCSVMSDSPLRLLCPWDFLGKNTGMCCHSLLQGIFPTQGSNLSPEFQADSFFGGGGALNYYYFLKFKDNCFTEFCIFFCQTSARISHRYTHQATLLNFPPISFPIPPF